MILRGETRGLLVCVAILTLRELPTRIAAEAHNAEHAMPAETIGEASEFELPRLPAAPASR
jgi:hypothetical protein